MSIIDLQRFDLILIKKWPKNDLEDASQKFVKNFLMIKRKFILVSRWSLPQKVSNYRIFIICGLENAIFFKPVPNFRVLFRLLSSRFLNFCTTFFLQFIVLKIFFKNFFDNFSLLKFWIFQLWIFFQNIFVIFKKV